MSVLCGFGIHRVTIYTIIVVNCTDTVHNTNESQHKRTFGHFYYSYVPYRQKQ